MQDWKKIAQNLKVNTSTRIQCCGNDNTAIISRSIKGCNYYCFRCHKHEFFKSDNLLSIHDIMAMSEKNNEIKCEMPKDATSNFTDDSLFWLSKHGITHDLRLKYNIQYSPYFDRVLLPVYENNTLTFLQCRAVQDFQKPKYINKRIKKTLFKSKPFKDTKTVVITEDILSAIKVGEVTNAISLLGTSPPSQLIKEIEPYDIVFIWLDDDRAGISGTKLVHGLLSITDKHIVNINTELDPKCYNFEQIQEIIKNA